MGLSIAILVYNPAAEIPIFAVQPTAKTDFLTTPTSRGFEAVFLPAIRAAKSEILVVARLLTSKAILEALSERAHHGVDVRILLAPETNASVESPTPHWIIKNGAGLVYIDRANRYDQLLVIDQKQVIVGALPFTAEAPVHDLSTELTIQDPAFAHNLRNALIEHLTQLKPLTL